MKKLLTILIATPLYLSSADWGVGYTNIKIDIEDEDSVTVGAATVSVGTTSEDGKFSGEVGLALPVQDDKLYGVEVELKTSPFVRGMYHFNENFFLTGNWGRYKFEIEGFGSESDSEAGVGLGVAFPTDAGQFRLIYENVDDSDLISVQYKF